ncbi:efflux RND transporter periplasmic adaptor subunit [Draconibacterium sp.]|nr:efflux RND transporter periplasmic adaptor subunit [Draconibacterium sp.]
MKKIQLFLIMVFAGILFSCNSGNPSGEENREQSEIPPSLQAAETGLLLVRLSDKEQNELKVETVEVISKFIDYPVTAPGVVFPAPKNTSIISCPIDGQVSSITKNEGSWVQKGEVLFVIQSLEFGSLVSEFLQTHAEEHFQTNRLKRLKQLVEENISSANELERATAEYDRAIASSRASYSKLKAVGVTDSEIQAFAEAERINPILKIKAPIDGVIERNFVELGQSVNALENLSRVLDTREVLIRGYLSPDDARLINVNDSVTISKRENMQAITQAVITSINPGLDENSRSVVTNILVKTQNGWPKPGENVRLDIVTSSKKEIIAIPVEAITYDGNQAIVFVQKEKGVFEKRNIEVTEMRENFVFVGEGLKSGEALVKTKVFSLKALSRFDKIAEE